jgi:hypothetical protein
MTKKYTLTMSAKHAEILVRALDLYSRIGIGQFEEVARVYETSEDLTFEQEEDLKACLVNAKVAVGHPKNGSYGIHNAVVSDKFRAAWDLQQVVRHRMAYDARPEGNPMSVHFDTPFQCSKVPLATIVSEDVAEPKPEPT